MTIAPDDLARSCAGKTRYETEDFAKSVATDCWYKRRVWLRAYACAACAGFNLTRSGAPPAMQPGWRLPKVSERSQGESRNRRARRRK